MKIEPMSVEEIKTQVDIYNSPTLSLNSVPGRLILAWAHERARANMYCWETLHREHDVTRECLGCGSTDDPRHKWGLGLTDTDEWLAAVLEEIGWPKE